MEREALCHPRVHRAKLRLGLYVSQAGQDKLEEEVNQIPTSSRVNGSLLQLELPSIPFRGSAWAHACWQHATKKVRLRKEWKLRCFTVQADVCTRSRDVKAFS